MKVAAKFVTVNITLGSWRTTRLNMLKSLRSNRSDRCSNVCGDLLERSILEITSCGSLHTWKRPVRKALLNPLCSDKNILVINVYVEDPSRFSAICVFQLHMKHLTEGELE